MRRPELTLERRNVVLNQMRKAGHLSRVEVDSLKQLPIELNFNRSSHIDIAAPYYRQHLAKLMMAVKPVRKTMLRGKTNSLPKTHCLGLKIHYMDGVIKTSSPMVQIIISTPMDLKYTPL